jgi:hypothetical protein
VSVPLSVFSTFDAFSQINPVVKAPTAVLDNGLLLMDLNILYRLFAGSENKPQQLHILR